mgnify:CR=1 FL=1
MHYQVKSTNLTTVSSVMGQILFSFGLIICVLIDKIKSLYIRLIIILILTLLFFLLWAELAIGKFKMPILGS